MKRFLSTIFFLSVFLMSCSPNLKTIKQNPKKFTGKELSIRADVIRAYNIPFTEIFIYEVYDHSDTMLVVSMHKPGRKNGEETLLNGRIFFLSGNTVDSAGNGLVDTIRQLLTENGIVNEKKATKMAKTVVQFMEKVLKDRNLFIVMVES